MIVTLVGTGPDSFDRLIRPLDRLAKERQWDVFVQLGHTDYEPENCQYQRFVDRDRLLSMIRDADLIIAQGGYGSIRDALSYDKPIVAVPRYPELNEAPDHQDEMVRAMEAKGYLIGVYDIECLESAVDQGFDFRPESRETSKIPSMLAEYITTL